MTNLKPISSQAKPDEACLRFVRFKLPAMAILSLLLLALQVSLAQASIIGPYTIDADTLHLWHMDDQAVPVIDRVDGGLQLNALRNGATLGNASYQGFGNALSTYDGGPDTVKDVGRDAYLAARPLVNGLSDNVTMSYAGTSGAFTYEAIVRIDFDPETNFGTNSSGNGRGAFMQLISLDADESTNRACEFRFVPVGVLEGNTQPLLEFINLNQDNSPQSLTAPVPTNGADAINFGKWYHLAVTYDADSNRSDNLKFYWTLMDSGRTAANLVGSGQMLNRLPSGCAPDFAIGQTGRQSPACPYPNNNFVGMIDEVRMSGVARSPSQMLFGDSVIVAGTPPSTVANISPGSSGQVTPVKPPEVVPPVHDRTAQESSAVTSRIACVLLISAALVFCVAIVIRMVSTRRSSVPSVVTHAVEASLPARITLPPAGGANLELHEKAPSNGDVKEQAESPPQMAATPPTPAAKLPENVTSFRKPPPPKAEVSSKEEGEEAGFRGVLRKVGLQDLIQMECLTRKSSILEISNANLHGRICIQQGEIIHAAAGELVGEEAFRRLLCLRSGKFSLKPFEAQETRTISAPWIHLLMEAARQRDEDTEMLRRSGKNVVSFTRSSTTAADDLLTMAGILSEHPQVKEILVCSSEGRSLFSSKCEDPIGREEMCSFLSGASRILSGLLPVGEFVSLEIVRSESKTILQKEQGCHLLIDLEQNLSPVS